MRRTAGYTWTDYKTNTQITKELKITPILDKLLEYKRNWIQLVNRMPHNRLPSVMKQYSPTGRRNYGRPLKRLLDTWDRNGSTSGPTPWQIYDDDDDDEVQSPAHLLWFTFGTAKILTSRGLQFQMFPIIQHNNKRSHIQLFILLKFLSQNNFLVLLLQ